MIGTIRRHSKWLWALIITATIISFLGWNINSRMGGTGGRTGDFGSVYGKKITQQQYLDARNEFKLFYLFHYSQWPEKANVADTEMERETYVRLLLIAKADDLGIHVSVDSAATAASQMLRSLARDGQAVTPAAFVAQVLQPEGLTLADFQNFARHDIVIQQLVQTLGLTGQLLTPQEAADAYVREHQELSAQMVYFSASNYVSSVTFTPDELGNFFTNYLAEYRLPDRLQLNYVEFGVSNYLAQSKAELAKTNFDAQVDDVYAKYGAKAFPDAKTPDEAKAKIREEMIRERALVDARMMANDFAAAVFKIDPARAENLAAVAKAQGLSVQTTAPFAASAGPKEFTVPEDFPKTAANLTADDPFASIISPDGVYIVALAGQIPSTIPAFADIKDRVTQDFQMQQAVALARATGTNFGVKLMISEVAGKSFAAVVATAGLKLETLPPFSLSTTELPQLGGRIELNQLKQIAFTTQAGHASNFEETGDGGFVLFVQSQLPVDPTAMRADLPQFTAQLRRARENEAFQEWLNAEANRELRDTPFAQRAMAK
jgi:hypothetical protein